MRRWEVTGGWGWGQVQQRRWGLRQIGGVREVATLPLVQPLVEERAEDVDLLGILFLQLFQN